MHTAPSYEAPSSSVFHSEHRFSNWHIFHAFIAPDPTKSNKIFQQLLLKWVIMTMKQ